MGKWCLHASSFSFDRIFIKVAGNQDRHKSLDKFDFEPLVSLAHLCFFSSPQPKAHKVSYSIVRLWRPSSSSSIVLTFEQVYLKDQSANFSPNSSVASLGGDKGAIGFGADRIKTVVTMATESAH